MVIVSKSDRSSTFNLLMYTHKSLVLLWILYANGVKNSKVNIVKENLVLSTLSYVLDLLIHRPWSIVLPVNGTKGGNNGHSEIWKQKKLIDKNDLT